VEGQSNLYSLADLLPDKLIFILEMGKIIYANEKFLKVTGYTIQELNENMKEIPSFNNEELTSYTIKVKTKSGQVREIKFSTENIQLQGWQIILAVGIDTANYIVLDNRQTETEKKYQTLVENINEVIFLTDDQGCFTYMSPVVEKMFFSAKIEDFYGRSIINFIHPDDQKTALRDIEITLKGEKIKNTYRVLGINRTNEYYLRVSSRPLFEEGRVTGIAGICFDITEQKRAEKALQESEQLLRGITDNMLDMICTTDTDGISRYISPSYETILGYKAEDLLGNPFANNIHPDDSGYAFSAFWAATQTKNSRRFEYRYRHSRKGYIWMETIANPLLDDNQELTGVILSSRDITERKQMEEQLKYLSLHDNLTGLYNRTYFEQEMSRLQKGRFSLFGIIVCDIDGLKFINDTRGHKAGDDLIISAAEAIKSSFRAEDMVARIGGDEFAVLLLNCDSKTMEKACRRIKQNVSSHNKENPESYLSISIGFAISNGEKVSVTDIFKEADNKMYKEKVYNSQATRSSLIRALMESLEVIDFAAEGHVDRLQALIKNMAEVIDLPKGKIMDMYLLAQFHDIGKVGIAVDILFKQGALTPDELIEIRRHSEIGHRIVQYTPDLLRIADWILKHHEWWNGEGYPFGLKGEEIPLECRIMAIVDAYDSMTSDRPYRKALPPENAIAELLRCSGTQFDPVLVDKFVEIIRRNQHKISLENKTGS
jgi:diguanylate cyclase (GGDEF)-like protein/PAS domain S-box-containing protein